MVLLLELIDDPFKIEDVYGSNNELIDKTIFLIKDSTNCKEPPNKNFLFTPLKRSELKRQVSQHIINQNRPSEKEGIPQHKKGQTKVTGKVLLVDDSEDSRLLIKIFLKKTNIELDIAVDGVKGLKNTKRKNTPNPMDVQMPMMDGLNAQKR